MIEKTPQDWQGQPSEEQVSNSCAEPSVPVSPLGEPYWCTSAPNIQRVWSPSSIRTLGECPRRYQLRYVQGWESKSANLDLIFGIAFHWLMEQYWKRRFKGEDHEAIIRDLTATALAWKMPDSTRRQNAGKTALGLARSFVWYFENYPKDELDKIQSHSGSPAIELHFVIALPILNPDGEPYYVQGYVDQLRTWAATYTVWDYKTTGGGISDYIADKFDIDIQNQVYILAAQTLTHEKYALFVADVVGVAVTYTDFLRPSIQVSPASIEEAIQDITSWIRLAERFDEQGYYPKNTGACNFCDYNRICDKDPVVQPRFLAADFLPRRRTYVGKRDADRSVPGRDQGT